ncbi:hypothetical protein FBULB1_5942 [Fusarium bulbicola]|nr:hypothetical protein FBULB1_5942 [Fusarium bulbicola]
MAGTLIPRKKQNMTDSRHGFVRKMKDEEDHQLIHGGVPAQHKPSDSVTSQLGNISVSVPLKPGHDFHVPVVVDKQLPIAASNITELKKVSTEHIVPRLRQPIATGVAVLASRCSEACRDVSVLPDERLARGRRSALPFGTSDGQHLAVSCFYTSNQWTSRQLDGSENHEPHPLLRLATSCHDVGTRYGFIFSDHELVVARVSGTPTAGLIGWQSTPWEAAGPGVLTVNLSLFLMVMMAMHDSHRPILLHHYPFPVNFWYHFQNIDGDWVRRHHLSRREVFYPLRGAITQLPDDIPFEDVHIIE